MDIKINFINQSNDQDNSEVVIFGKNEATGFDEIAIAWTVIRNCGRGGNHPFVYPLEIEVGASDAFGNYTPRFPARSGQLFEMVRDDSGDVLRLSKEPASSYKEYQVLNSLPTGAITAMAYKAGRLYASKSNIASAQKAAFQFKPTIAIGVASEIEEGQVLDAAILSDIKTEFNLLGVVSADIVMTGGGIGPSAKPFVFSLANVVMV